MMSPKGSSVQTSTATYGPAPASMNAKLAKAEAGHRTAFPDSLLVPTDDRRSWCPRSKITRESVGQHEASFRLPRVRARAAVPLSRCPAVPLSRWRAARSPAVPLSRCPAARNARRSETASLATLGESQPTRPNVRHWSSDSSASAVWCARRTHQRQKARKRAAIGWLFREDGHRQRFGCPAWYRVDVSLVPQHFERNWMVPKKLHELIHDNADRIVEVFVGRARRHDLPPREAAHSDVVDDLNRYVRELALAYQLGDDDRSEAVAKAHGGQRWYAGYDLRSVLLEYGVLRSTIGDVVAQAGYEMTTSELDRVAQLVNSALAEAAVEFTLRATEQLNEALRSAEKAVRAREDVIAVVSHDLKNPLSVIFGSVAMLDDALGEDDLEVARGPFDLMWRASAAPPPV